MILQKIKADAEAKPARPSTQAVITVPAYFNDNSGRRRRTPARSPGSTSSASSTSRPQRLAYGLDKEGTDQTILVFDLGGGTFDISVLKIGDGVFEVKSTVWRQPPRRR